MLGMRPVVYVMLCVRIQNGVLKFEFECSIIDKNEKLLLTGLLLKPRPPKQIHESSLGPGTGNLCSFLTKFYNISPSCASS